MTRFMLGEDAPEFVGGATFVDETGGSPRLPRSPRLPTVGRGAQGLLGRLSDAEGTDDANAQAHGYASGYDALYYGYRRPAGQKALTSMTLDEVDALQRDAGSHLPVGRYQFMRSTLGELRAKLGLSGREQFTPELQDALGGQLMRKRGYDDPSLSGDEVQSRFSREWASVPDLDGHSHYKGQPVGVSSAAFQQYLSAARAADDIR